MCFRQEGSLSCKGSRCLRLQPGKWGFQVSQGQGTRDGRDRRVVTGGVSASVTAEDLGRPLRTDRWRCALPKDGEALAAGGWRLRASEGAGAATVCVPGL